METPFFNGFPTRLNIFERVWLCEKGRITDPFSIGKCLFRESIAICGMLSYVQRDAKSGPRYMRIAHSFVRQTTPRFAGTLRPKIYSVMQFSV